MENAQTNGNGSEKKVKEPSALAVIHKEWLAKGGKRPAQKEIEALKKEVGAADDDFQKAQKALTAARERRQKAAIALMSAVGTKVNCQLADGRVLEPSCRSTSVFYRGIGDTESV